jgi:ribosomal protein S18 acetylase RimI-like enzyme
VRDRREPTPGTVALEPAVDPAVLIRLFEHDRHVHPYGLADVEQLWDLSRWWVDGQSAVGVMDLPGSPVPVLYAVSARDANGTLELLAQLDAAGQLPPRFVVTGPRGLTQHLTRDGRRRARWSKRYDKLALDDDRQLEPADPDVVTVDRSQLEALHALYATDPAAGDFFHTGLLATGGYVALYAEPPCGGAMVATAGIHVIDRVNRVAAIGNVATHPDHRGRGLGRRVTATLCHRLLAEVDVVGLNVTLGNVAARRLYERLGFHDVLPYEEAELERTRVRTS